MDTIVKVGTDGIKMGDVIEQLEKFNRGPETVNIGIRVPAVVDSALEDLAKAQGSNKSNLVRAAIAEYLKRRLGGTA